MSGKYHYPITRPYIPKMVDEDLFNLILDSSTAYCLDRDKAVSGPSPEEFFYREARACEKLLKKILSTRHPLFGIHKTADLAALKPTVLGYRLLDSLQGEVAEREALLPLHEINPYLGLLFDAFSDWKDHYSNQHLIAGPIQEISNVCTWLNARIDQLKKTAETSSFKKSNQRFLHSANKNYRSVCHYTRSLFDRHSRLLVIRVDLWYVDVAARMLHGEHYSDVKRDLECFLNSMRTNKIFRNKVGFITKVEHGTCRGFHIHGIFFYDGSKSAHDIFIAKQIGEFWKKVTNGRGHYWNCNAQKYKHRGIGQISHSETQLRHNLEKYVLAYVTKVDRFTRIVLPNGDRALRRGIVTGRRSTRGRPRA